MDDLGTDLLVFLRNDEKRFVVADPFDDHVDHFSRDEDHDPRIERDAPVTKRGQTHQDDDGIHIDHQLAQG